MSRTAVVIGRGPAGLLSATRLLDRGYSVSVISNADGTLAMWSGDFSFGREPDSYRTFSVALSREQWRDEFQQLAQIFSDFGVSLRVPEEGIPHTITATGNLRPTFATPSWQYAALTPRDLILIAVDGLADSIATAQAENYRAATECDAIVRRLPLPPGWDQNWGALRFASYCDTSSGAAWLMSQLETALRDTPNDRPVLLPQIIGFDRTTELLGRFRASFGREFFEFSLLSPSVGGVRIRDRWEAKLRSRGVHFVDGFVREVGPTPFVCTTDGRLMEPDVVILATGGVLGGGLVVDVEGRAQDTLVNRQLGWVRTLEDLNTLGHSGADSLGGARVLAVGRQLGSWNPNRDHSGGAMILGTVHEAFAILEEVDR